MKQSEPNKYDVVVIGGGQAGLSLGFYLRRTGLSYVILDAQPEPGGAWTKAWQSLTLFSPAQWSSLPGWLMPGGGTNKYPSQDEVISYLRQYEERYNLPIKRPVQVTAVKPDSDESSKDLIVETSAGNYIAKAVVSATGSWQNPYIPHYPGQEDFRGVQIHSAEYQSPEQFAGQRIIVVGSGNSGAQIMAEVSLFAEVLWVTLDEPQFLPDDVDGRVLFDVASEQYRNLTQGADSTASAPKRSDLLGSIVMVEPVKQARDRGVLKSVRPFVRFNRNGVVWEDGSETEIDVVIWATGFKPALDHLRSLGVVTENGRVDVTGTRSIREPRLWLVGYGNWTGFASATLIGVGRSARATVQQIVDALTDNNQH
jgi:cation diffusion facilitator CzcD-associated flavoprotein CzcO